MCFGEGAGKGLELVCAAPVNETASILSNITPSYKLGFL